MERVLRSKSQLLSIPFYSPWLVHSCMYAVGAGSACPNKTTFDVDTGGQTPPLRFALEPWTLNIAFLPSFGGIDGGF